MKMLLRSSVFILIFFMLSWSAFAAVWNGLGGDNLASNASNWEGNVLPFFVDDVVFDNTSAKDCTWDINETLSSLSINGYAGSITLMETLTLSNGIAGKWKFFIAENSGYEQGPYVLTFSHTGNNGLVAPGSDGNFIATISGLNITITNLDHNEVTTTYKGTISADGNAMLGTFLTSDGNHSGTWRAMRFAQADLTGIWDFIVLKAGQDTGWAHGVMTVNSAGSGTITEYLDTGSNDGGTPGCFALSISETGSVTIGGVCGDDTMPLSMSPDKGLIVGTGTGSDNSAQLLVLRKRVDGVTYSAADINNSQYSFHALFANGMSPAAWVYGVGQTDGSGNFTFTSANIPAGPVFPLPPPEGPLNVNANGIVTSSSNGTFYGIMTADKKAIFEIDTFDATPNYRLTVFFLEGQTFTTADLAGSYNFHGIVDVGAAATWQTGTFAIDNLGNQVYQSYLDSNGVTGLPPNSFLFINSGGQMTRAGSASYHGQMSFNKDLYVRTQSQGGGYSLTLGFRQ